MSVEAMAVVLHHSKATGTNKLVLVGIANHDGDGGAWPSVATLAKYANVIPRNVQKAIGALKLMGELEVVVQGGGGQALEDVYRPNLYRVRVACPPGCSGGPRHVVQGVSQATPGGVSDSTPGGVSQATPEPSLRTRRSVKPPALVSPEAHASENRRRRAHQNEPNTRRALSGLGVLALDHEELVDWCYELGNGDPWDGYLLAKPHLEATLAGARDPEAALRARLRKAAS